jgi:hypothetical protein
MFILVFLACCAGSGLCDELITPSEESFWIWELTVCDLDTSKLRRPRLETGCCATGEKQKQTPDRTAMTDVIGYASSSAFTCLSRNNRHGTSSLLFFKIFIRNVVVQYIGKETSRLVRPILYSGLSPRCSRYPISTVHAGTRHSIFFSPLK